MKPDQGKNGRRVGFGLAVLLLCLSTAQAAVVDYRSRGDDHYFNLEYDEAIADYLRLLEQSPGDPSVHNHIATAILYKELHRLGMLEPSAFKGDNEFLKWEKPTPNPEVQKEFERYLFEGRKLAESILEESPDDRLARFALSHNYGLQANYQFMIEKTYVGALRNGNRARKHSNKLQKRYPEFTDAYLAAGVQEYVVGSLPWALRALIALGGVTGSKEKGEAYVTRVAKEGNLARNQARVLLVLLLRRERRPLEAAEVLKGLVRDYPRNYILGLELASMYQDAHRLECALETFQWVQAKVKEEPAGFGRMPQRAQDALERKIEKLQTELDATGASKGCPAVQPVIRPPATLSFQKTR